MTIISLKRTASIIRKSVDAALDRHNARLVSLSMTHNKLLNVIADSVAADLAPKGKAGKKAAGKASAKGTVVNGTRFTDPESGITYAADEPVPRGRGDWYCVGVKKSHLSEKFGAKFILKNRTKFQPARAR